MVTINKREVVQRIVDGLRVEGGSENVPSTTEDRIRIVYVKFVKIMHFLNIQKKSNNV